MNKFWLLAKWALMIWGVLCLCGMIAIGGLVAWQLGPGNKASSEPAKKTDVRHVLNWCGLGDERIEEVIHSFVSARSLTGDHLDAHQIRISHVEIAELKRDELRGGWTRCDEVDGVLKDSIEFVRGWLHREEISWFLSGDELGSRDVFVYPWSIYCSGTRPTAVKLIFVRPRDRMVFYISCKA